MTAPVMCSMLSVVMVRLVLTMHIPFQAWADASTCIGGSDNIGNDHGVMICGQ